MDKDLYSCVINYLTERDIMNVSLICKKLFLICKQIYHKDKLPKFDSTISDQHVISKMIFLFICYSNLLKYESLYNCSSWDFPMFDIIFRYFLKKINYRIFNPLINASVPCCHNQFNFIYLLLCYGHDHCKTECNITLQPNYPAISRHRHHKASLNPYS